MPTDKQSVLMILTDFGDSGLISFVVILSALFLFFARCRREAFSLILTLLLASVGIALAKIMLFGCGAYYPQFGINSPSGHAALSSAVYLMIAALCAEQVRPSLRIVPYCLASALIAIISLSRVLLSFHTVGEVCLGLAVGLGAYAAGRWFLLRGRYAVSRFNLWIFMAILAAGLTLAHGNHLPAETLVKRIAVRLQHYTPCGI